MFPLVQILHQKGCYITGSDNNETDTIEYERNVLGIPVHIGHDPDNLGGADCVIYTTAISRENPELKAAFSSNALVLERSEMLGADFSGISQCDLCFRNPWKDHDFCHDHTGPAGSGAGSFGGYWRKAALIAWQRTRWEK